MERRCPIPSAEYSTAFPWASERSFRLWLYNVSHSQLRFRSDDWGVEQDVVWVEFSGVERMEVDPTYRGPVTLSSVESHGPYPARLKYPQRYLLLELATFDHIAFIIAAGVRITRETQDGELLELLLATNKREQDEKAAG
jgi:hypothetical protein